MSEAPGPDDVCGVCDRTREYHGDANHKFSIDGFLLKLDTPPPARQQPPRVRGEGPMMPDGNISIAAAVNLQHDLSLRLVSRLTTKGLLDSDDLIYILGGNNDAPPSQ